MIFRIFISGTRYIFYYLFGHIGTLGKFVQFETGITITGAGTVNIGDFAKLGKDVWINTVSHATNKGEVIIGKNTDVGRYSTISAANHIELGDSVLIAQNVMIVDHIHAYDNINVPVMAQGLDKVAPVTIASGSWIGTNVVILPGTTIGKHCVIGANSVVNSDIPDYSIATGAPAKIIKTYKDNKWVKNI